MLAKIKRHNVQGHLSTIIELFNVYLCSLEQKPLISFDVHQVVWRHLIMNGYFVHLRKLMDTYYRLNLDEPPLWEALFSILVIGPLGDYTRSVNSSIRPLAVSSFIHHFLAGPLEGKMADELFHRLLRQLPDSLSASKVLDSFVQIDSSVIQEIDSQFVSKSVSKYSSASFSFLWTFFVTSQLIANHHASILTPHELKQYLTIVQRFTDSLASFIRSWTIFDFHYFTLPYDPLSDMDDVDDMYDQLAQKQSEEMLQFASFVEQIFSVIDSMYSGCLQMNVIQVVVKEDRDALVALSHLCHSMLLFHPFATHRHR